MDASNDPSRILEQARQHLEALKQAGLSREALIALLGEDDQSKQQQQLQVHLQHPPPPPQYQPPPPPPPPPPTTAQGGIESQLSPSYAVPNHHFIPSHQIRSSISSVASNSSGRESILSTATAATAQSSVSSIGGSFAKPATPSSASSEAKYWCTSCDKTFKRKFDWKRHEEEFHERWRKYPCPNCNQSFWGPNTFNQHHKSAHGCKTCPHSDGVVKYMRKRRAWGCGFCAAMHTKLEKHYEHVAAHFESGAQKQDWMHSNVIYGLLHQPAVLEAWRELVNRKQSKFNGHQPMFSWGIDNTGRQQGYVEGETPGQLQDFLEFFDGSSEQAQRITQCAWGYCHVVLKPKSSGDPVPPQETQNTPQPDQCSLSRQVTITSQRGGLRRVASTSLMPISRQPSRRVSSADYREHMQGMQYTSPIEQSNPYQQQFMVPPQPIPSQQISPQPMHVEPMQMGQPMNPRPLSLDKELPPAPLLPSPMDTSPMDVDFNMYNDSNDQLLKPPSLQDWQSFSSAHSFSDTQSLSSTLFEEQAAIAAQQQHLAAHQHNGGIPMNWGELNHYGGAQHPQG
ncbi:homeobox and C2H2 transcription protein [Seiridium cupressi]